MSAGRNDPCPCGSGKKYKRCCLSRGTFKGHGSQAPPAPQQRLEMAKSALSRGDATTARYCLRPLLNRPKVPASTWALACGIEMQDRQFNRARQYIGKALEQEPRNATYLYNLATVLALDHHKEEAVPVFEKAIAIRPEFYQAYNNLANTLRDLGRPDEASECYLKVLDRNLYDLTTSSHLLISLHQFSFNDPDRLFELHKTVGAKIAAQVPAHSPRWRPTGRRERIRLGYLSPRFSREIVGYFFKPVFDHHDRERFEIYLYSATPREDDLTEYLRERADKWTDVKQLSDTDLCRRLAEDEIDILIDLAGHAPDNRITAIARKPSPVQVSMLDYFDTTGLDTIDYYVTDRYSTPAGGVQKFTEKLIYLDQPRLVYEAPPYAPAVPPRPRERALVFGSFNRHEKFSPAVMEAWCAVLREVPDSRLILKNAAFAEEEVKAGLRSRFSDRGIGPERIEFRGKSPHEQMLREYGDIDIALDTFPYNGGLTTCEALWMGTPVMTMEGDTIISRQTASMLQSLGLENFIASSPEAFAAIGRHWSEHRDELSSLHDTLRGRMEKSSLTDGAAYARNLEHALERSWDDYLTGQPPAGTG